MKLYNCALNIRETKEVLQGLSLGKTPLLCVGLSNIHKAHIAAALKNKLNKKTLILTPDEGSASRLFDDIRAFCTEGNVMQFPAGELSIMETEAISSEYSHKRIACLEALREGNPLVVASCEAALQYTISPEALISSSLLLKGSFEGGRDGLVKILLEAGYKSGEKVDGLCTFSVRGGIVDFFSPSAENPVRVEFWGDEIDSMAYFREDNQRRGEVCDEVMIVPAREAICKKDDLIDFLKNEMKRVGEKSPAYEKLGELLENAEGESFSTPLDRFLPILYGRPYTLFDYFGNDDLIIVSDIAGINSGYKDIMWQYDEDAASFLEKGICYKDCCEYFADLNYLYKKLNESSTLIFEQYARSMPHDLEIREKVDWLAMAEAPWSGELSVLTDELKTAFSQGFSACVLLPTERGCNALLKDLQDEGFNARYESEPILHPNEVILTDMSVSSGFSYPGDKVIVFSHRRASASSKRSKKKKSGEAIRALSDLSVGDYVVHSVHGIGVFCGIVKQEAFGVIKDYIKIKYRGGDLLFIPVTQMDLVSKYIGKQEDGNIRLSKLGSAEWQKTRTKVRKAVAEMADELMVLYKKRLNAKGHAFSPDTDWQRDFELRFPYEETDDQLRAIAEIKEDMEKEKPMDRLLCGDVGFGKTEVAIRAAFKCVCDSMQCAVMVPTTILAWQHYKTFTERMEGFPIKVELLSRFRTAKQQKEVLAGLKDGSVDIVIGTHRLLSKDVEFKNIGLCIIDEEQRFGVAHKERFKQMRESIDVLTLSATPIPRTLSMAMSGIRDMSVIEEAPSDRHPVQTYVLEHDWGIIATALRRELRRGGQAFYLHNDIESISSTAAKIQSLLPDARIAVGHGKMGEHELSELWKNLVEREIDILVCTTIIETGVDVPNCNTLIIEDADKMGLSQLYQLRGRVGRSNRRAFAYLTFKPQKVISEIASKRLNAIKEFTSFGSGFRIAMRDMEIRGAGSVIGASQHGHMEAVGYEMYLRLLSEAVSESRGEPVKPETECQVDIPMDAYIPENYIESVALRLDIYKKIAAVKTEKESEDILDELIDRFGDPPPTVTGLVKVALLRNRAAALGVTMISQRDSRMIFFLSSVDPMMAAQVAGKLKNRVLFNAGTKPYIDLKMKNPKDTLGAITEFLDAAEDAPV